MAVSLNREEMLFGAVAQLGERLICIQEVVGSIPSGSTILTVSRRVIAAMFRREKSLQPALHGCLFCIHREEKICSGSGLPGRGDGAPPRCHHVCVA